MSELDTNIAMWSEYPRMQLQRDSYTNLNGPFDYQITNGSFPRECDYKCIHVPFGLGTKLSLCNEVLGLHQTLWYRKRFNYEITSGFVLLHFEAVDQCCEVYLNGVLVGHHEGGYAPFSFDVTSVIQKENELLVKVHDFHETSIYSYGRSLSQRRAGLQKPQSGIYRTVWLETVQERSVLDLKITPDYDASCVYLRMAGNFQQAVVTVFENKKLIHRGISGMKDYTIPLENFHPWSPEDPFLYDLYIQTEEETVKSYFAMRKFSYGKDDKGKVRFELNNKPYFLCGIVNQGYHYLSGLTYESDEEMVKQLFTIKQMGFNMIRNLVKEESRRFYYHCDRLGILVMQDMMNGGNPANIDQKEAKSIFGLKKQNDQNYQQGGRERKESQEMYYHELDDMMDALYNHPCIFAWCAFNEGWGQFDSCKVISHIKEYDSTRLVDGASGFYDQGCGDFLSIHTRKKKNVRLGSLDQRIPMFTSCGGFVYQEAGHGETVSVVGDYVFMDKLEYNQQVMRFLEDEVYDNIQKGLSGYIYYQLMDVMEDCSGLLTSDGEIIKVDVNRMKRFNERCKRCLK